MDIEHIREFVTLAETGNFQEAADRLFIAQSSLSRHIKNLEESLGVSLFNRTTRKVTLSRYGLIFLPYAKEITRIQYEFTTAFFNEKRDIQGTVTIGSIPMMKPYRITDVLARFQRENKSFTINVTETDSLELIEMLRNEQCDFAFIRENDDSDNEFIKLPFATDCLVAVLPATHPLASYEELNISQLAKEPLLLIGKDAFMYNLCVSTCQQEGFSPKIAFTSKRAENIIDLVDKGMGIALLMKKPAASIATGNSVILNLKPSITTTIYLAYSRTHKMSTAATHFLDLVKAIL